MFIEPLSFVEFLAAARECVVHGFFESLSVVVYDRADDLARGLLG